MSNQEPKIESFFNIPTEDFNQDIIQDSEKNKENLDQIAFDKKYYWNLGEVDLSLKKESDSKLSIDNPDISKHKLKEYLNEDLLNEIDASPMNTPKNIINENNEINIDINNKDLFQFSLYNKNEGEKELNDIKFQEDKENKEENENEEEINELNIIKLDEINKIKEDEGGGNLNLNNEKDNNNEIINDNININNFIDFNKEVNFNPNPSENKNPIKEDKNINIKETTDNKAQNKNTSNNYYPGQYQYPFIQFPYITQPLMNPVGSFGHENKFDGNKKYQVFVPFTVFKKTTKAKKPFEIREGDWTCSNCNNLNFSFRVKCNRCYITKDQSELEKNKEKNENKEQKFSQTKSKVHYPNANINNNNAKIMQYKYYPGFIYVPMQAQFLNKGKNEHK